MMPIPLEDLPPSYKAAAFAVREQILQNLEQHARQREQQEAMRHKLQVKAKRRIRKQQKKGR